MHIYSYKALQQNQMCSQTAVGVDKWRERKNPRKSQCSQEGEAALSPLPDLYRCCKRWRVRVAVPGWICANKQAARLRGVHL